MPRAGSTLIEQILASHSQVEGTMELPDIPALAARIGSGNRPVADLTADEVRALGHTIIASLHEVRGMLERRLRG